VTIVAGQTQLSLALATVPHGLAHGRPGTVNACELMEVRVPV
jgi:hypothetical protein